MSTVFGVTMLAGLAVVGVAGGGGGGGGANVVVRSRRAGVRNHQMIGSITCRFGIFLTVESHCFPPCDTAASRAVGA